MRRVDVPSSGQGVLGVPSVKHVASFVRQYEVRSKNINCHENKMVFFPTTVVC